MNLTPAQRTLLAAPYFFGPRPGSNFWSFICLTDPATKESIADGVEIEPLIRAGYLRSVELDEPRETIEHPTEGFEVVVDHRYIPTFDGREALALALKEDEAKE